MAPALRIPIALDLEGFKQQTAKAAAHSAEAMKLIASEFVKLNGPILSSGAAAMGVYSGGWISTATRIVSAFGAARLGVTAATVLMGAAISEARRELEEMLEVAQKSTAAGVTPEFFQSFTAEARKMKVEIKELEDALTHAFQSSKDKIDPNWQVLDETKRRISDVEKALRD